MGKRQSRKFLDVHTHQCYSLRLGPCKDFLETLCRYKNDPEVLAMTNLIAAYQRNEILEFEKILKVTSLCYDVNYLTWKHDNLHPF